VTALLPVTGIPLPFISAGGTSLLATFLVFGMLVSFARHEPAAVAAAQRAAANGTRGRLERWLRVPVPKAYAAPKRRPKRQPPAKKPAARAQPRRAAPQRPQPAVHRLPPRRTGPPAPYRHARGERKRA
jgi:cell division protein FtsW